MAYRSKRGKPSLLPQPGQPPYRRVSGLSSSGSSVRARARGCGRHADQAESQAQAAPEPEPADQGDWSAIIRDRVKAEGWVSLFARSGKRR